MPAVILDGKALGTKIRNRVKEESDKLKIKGVVPCLAVVLVGDNPASLSYVKAKEKALLELGMKSRDIRLPADTQEKELLSVIDGLNLDKDTHGILVQLPLPEHLDEAYITEAIKPEKDVDCFHPVSVGNMILGRPCFLPCTPHGILVILEENKIPISGSHVVVVGRSNIVGKPLLNLLIRREYNATVTLCHTGTKDLGFHTRQADILISAAGMPGLIDAGMIKENAAVIDVGVNRVPDASAKKGYRLCGDVNADVAEKASFFTPVPGGVGPMTIAMLLQNVVEAAQKVI